MKRWFLALATALGLFVAAPSLAQFTIDTSGRTPTNVEGLWWNSSQSGWGATFTQQFHIIFATIYTYDNAGNPVWYVATNCPVSGNGCSGPLHRVRNGSPLTQAWNGSGLSVQQVGNITIVFSDNNNAAMSFSIDGVTGAKQVTRQVYNTSGPGPGLPPPETSRQKTERLLGGTWSITYQIISFFTDRYTFNGVTPSTATPGDWVAVGVDGFNRLSVGTYSTPNNVWSIYAGGTIIDLFYIFAFDNLNRVSGCYYQISPPGSTNLSRCYSMVGTRSPQKALGVEGLKPLDDELRLVEAELTGKRTEIDTHVLDAYLRLRAVAAGVGGGRAER